MKRARKVTLLIVDDEAPIRKLLAKVAERAGFDVDTAKDGVEALEMFERKDYQIAIVDLMMPRISGYELVQKLNTIEPRPFVIVATALTNGDVANLDDSMVRRVIKKPFDINSVAAALIDTARQIAEGIAAIPAPPPEVIKVAPPSEATETCEDVAARAQEMTQPSDDADR